MQQKKKEKLNFINMKSYIELIFMITFGKLDNNRIGNGYHKSSSCCIRYPHAAIGLFFFENQKVNHLNSGQLLAYISNIRQHK